MILHAKAFAAPVRKLFSVFVLGILPLALAISSARAQAPTDNGAPLGIAPGSPEGSYALSGFEDVNLYNGSLSFSFPVQQIGGRGSAGYTAHMPIDLKWMVVKNEWYDEQNFTQYTWYNPSVAEWHGADYGPGSLSVRYSAWKPEGCYIGWDYYVTFRWAMTSIIFKGPDGTEHELVDSATMGSPTNYPGCSLNGYVRGPVFVSRDQPGMTFISDIDVRDSPYWGSGRIQGTLKMPDGTTYRFDETPHCFSWGCYYETFLTWMRDANGNKTTFTYSDVQYMGNKLTSIKDSLNRQITIEYNVNQSPYGTHDRLTYKGYGGANRVVRVQRDTLVNALRSDQYSQTVHTLFPTLDSSEDAFNPGVTSAIWLPDSDGVTRRYRFLYNSYGELARVELPTGGAIEYDWGPGLSNGGSGGVVNSVPNAAHSTEADSMMRQIYRRLLTRRAYDAGGVLLGSTTYSRPESQNYDGSINNAGYVSVAHLNASGQQMAVEKHYFYGSPATSLFTWQASPAYMPTYTPYAAYRDGREYQTDYLNSNGTSLLRRSTQSWDQTPVSWWYGSAETSPANCPYVKETIETLADSGQVKKTSNINPQTGQVMIDQFGNPLDTWLYDYGQGEPGPLLRRLHTEFLTTNPVNSVNYTSRTSSSSPHKLNLPTRMSVYDPSGVERERTTIEYDNYASDTGHAALVDRPSISSLDAAYNIYYSPRGNPTATTRYLMTNGSITGSVTGYVQYDIAGNSVKTIDARGNATLFDFTDRFGVPDGEAQANGAPTELSSVSQYSYGFATLTINALGQTSYNQFDYYIGRPVDTQDQNGTTYSGYYNDVLDRPTQMISGANRDVSLKRQTLYTYDDVGRTLTTTMDFNAFNETNPLKSQNLYDGQGRTIESRTYEGVSAFIAVRQRFDALGRVYQVSNTFRNGETPVWTTTAFDELSRPLSVTSPDNAVGTNSYSGNWVTATDPAGKRKKTVNDGLGRLTAVYEDPNGVNYQTSYSYDVQDNMIGVVQGAQTRTFVYDSLNRMTSSTNPESGSVSYQYDNQGNLTQRTDARGIVTNISYDVLNRPTAKSYQNDGGITPSVAYFYDSQSVPGGAPAFSRGYSTGKLVAVTYSGGSNGDYFGYDAMGRTVLKIQQTGIINYQVSASYNVSGSALTVTYPSGHSASYAYDAAGRPYSLTGTLGDGAQRTYSTGITYAANGKWIREQFGTNTALYNKRKYNIRQQLYDMRLSTINDADNWNRGAVVNYYSLTNYGWGTTGSDTNGNLYVQQHWVPNDDAISSYSFMQDNYSYDALSRISSVVEYQDGTTQTGSQNFGYDRWGNRVVSSASGTGINNKSFSVDTNNNRLGVPSGQSGTMTYDNSGNLTNDTYGGQGQRTYDATNRMKQAWANGQWQTYNYDADGKRIKRTINDSETWQVYGIGGELLAEYSAHAMPSFPQKEYGYRNGELLIAASGQNCGAGYQGTKSWGATNPSLGHNTGHQEGSDWVATVSGDSAQHMAFGPYDNTFGQGHHSAKFMLQIDNTSGSDVVATVDVVTTYGTTILAQRQIRRNEFTTANQWQWFTLEFDNPCFGLVEARLYWHDTANMKFNQVTITGVTNAGSKVQWMVTDHLGTPRMIVDNSGSLASVSRHDYLPYGEELFAGSGTRTSGKGYSQADGTRQHFTGYERDNETGLDFAHARYSANVQGRFTSVDPVPGFPDTPQTWNAYTYTNNSPVNLTDANGMFANAEYGYDPGREMDPYLDYSKKRALWTNEIEQALAAYEQMVKTGLANLQKKKKEKEEQKKKPPVYDVTKDKTVAKQVEQIKKDAKPLPPGEAPVLSNVQVVVGDTVDLTDTTVRDAYGVETDNFTGTIRPVAYIPLDQGGNIIPDASGVGIQEIIQRNNNKAERIPNEGLKGAPPGGIFFDMQLIAQGQPTLTVKQHVLVAQLSRTGAVVSAFTIGENRINLTAWSPGSPGRPGSVFVSTAQPLRAKQK
ncbi:MAG TPA: RHS repeat-associated core domain-containing protein [Pyrinomonadaceae bacterium]